jgi:hypothetical protein
MLSFPDSAHRFLAAFETRSTALNDKRLVAWVKLQLLAEEVEAAKARLLSGTEGPNLSNPSVLIDFRDRFDQWEKNLSRGILNGKSSTRTCQ